MNSSEALFSEKELAEVEERIAHFDQYIQSVQSEIYSMREILVLFGITGAGKSTISTMLIEPHQLDFIKQELDVTISQDVLDQMTYYAQFSIVSKQGSTFEIGQGYSSTTTVPNLYFDNERLIVDLPGIFDTNDTKTTLLCIYSTQRVFKAIEDKLVRVLFCDSYSSVTDSNGAGFIYNFKRMINWLYAFKGGIDDIIHNLAIVFTRQTNHVTIEDLNIRLKKLLNAQSQVEADELVLSSAAITAICKERKIVFISRPTEKLLENNYGEIYQKRLQILLCDNQAFQARPFSFNKKPNLDPKMQKLLYTIKEKALTGVIELADSCKVDLKDSLGGSWLKHLTRSKKLYNFSLGIGAYLICSCMEAIFENSDGLVIDVKALKRIKAKNTGRQEIVKVIEKMEQIAKIAAIIMPTRSFFPLEGKFYDYFKNSLPELNDLMNDWRQRVRDYYNIELDFERMKAENKCLQPSIKQSVIWSLFGGATRASVWGATRLGVAARFGLNRAIPMVAKGSYVLMGILPIGHYAQSHINNWLTNKNETLITEFMTEFADLMAEQNI